MLGKIEGRGRRGRQRIRWLHSIIDIMYISLSKLWEMVKDREAWQLQSMGSQRVGHAYELEGIRVFASTNGEIDGATELAFIPRHYQVSNDVIGAEDSVGWYTYALPIGISGDCFIILRGESQYCTSTYMDNFVVEAVVVPVLSVPSVM